MDAERFDVFAKAIGRGIARRRVLASVAAGALGLGVGGAAPAVAGPEALPLEVQPSGSHAPGSVSAEKKRKKRKKKKKGGNPQPNNPNPNNPQPNEPPACTATSCPLPPECSQQELDTCLAPLIASIEAEAEACKDPCQDSESAACQECVAPIAARFQAEALACAEQSCDRSFTPDGMEVGRVVHRDGVTAERWWTRTCEKPCCYLALNACQEDVAVESLVCAAAAVVATAVSGGPGGPIAYGFCAAKLVYSMIRCDSRFNCESKATCMPDNTCCAGTPCGDRCCDAGAFCTSGASWAGPRYGCCNPADYPGEELIGCDGVCCVGHNLQCCAPGETNPCLC